MYRSNKRRPRCPWRAGARGPWSFDLPWRAFTRSTPLSSIGKGALIRTPRCEKRRGGQACFEYKDKRVSIVACTNEARREVLKEGRPSMPSSRSRPQNAALHNMLFPSSNGWALERRVADRIDSRGQLQAPQSHVVPGTRVHVFLLS